MANCGPCYVLLLSKFKHSLTIAYWHPMPLITTLNNRTICTHSYPYICIYNPSNIFARSRLVSTRHLGEYSPAKTGEYPRIFPNFQNCARCVKDLNDNKHNSLHLARKCARIFILGHYLFLVAPSFLRATLSENCSLLGTDNVRGQMS